ncbi:hypothetical protein [Thermodesulfomicrobium sp. WS]|nr:hypothetical protein [Thermodesulfomicrobium sp. WS]
MKKNSFLSILKESEKQDEAGILFFWLNVQNQGVRDGGQAVV